ncbi:MAG: UDP-N-acetylglucosamine 2-epimerase [Phycisphaerae bacterium]|nr:UDP-N-acetylglucosamine 2-epimerase [Phycisphaerae bacterium]
MAKRRIAVVTGTRAEYGIFRPVLEAINQHEKLDLQLIVTGMHLLRKFGYTVKDIQADGWRIDGKIRLQSQKDDMIEQSRGLGRAITGLTNEYARLESDMVLVMGDRLETFAAASAATASQIPLAHIHGGDIAQGIQDDAYRHAISKLAHLHFAASKGAKERLIRMGEDPWRVYRTGSPALDNFSATICKNISELNQWAGFDVREDYAIILQHPAGGTPLLEERRMTQTLRGSDRKHLKIIVLYPNCDPGYSGIIQAARHYCTKKNWPLLTHVPRGIYMGLLKHSRMLIGNSSSGIIEAGRLNVDVVNVKPRQLGRERGKNVIDVDYGTKNVSTAVQSILNRKRTGRKPCTIYGDGHSGKKIANILSRVKLDQRLKRKIISY